MTVRVKTKGRIIRILDGKTVIINLGSEHGVNGASIFHILAEPEDVIDPETNEILGSVKVTKGRVRASQVSEKFTIASSSWSETRLNPLASFFSAYETVEDTLKVDSRDLKPWKGRSEAPVRVGDEVEVIVEMDNEADEEDPEEYDEADDENVDANFHDGGQETVNQ